MIPCLALGSSVSKRRRDDGHILLQAGSLHSVGKTRTLLAAFVETCNESRFQTSGDEFFVAHDLAKEGQRRLNSAHCVFIEGPAHSIDSLRARASPDCEFRNHRIVVDRDVVAFDNATVVANSR